MGSWQPSWERDLHLLPPTFKEQENQSVAVVCSTLLLEDSHNLLTAEFIPDFRLEHFECNIQSPSYLFSLLQGRNVH